MLPSLDREVLIAAEADLTGEGREADGAEGRVGNVEEGVTGLGVQVAVVLLGAAVKSAAARPRLQSRLI